MLKISEFKSLDMISNQSKTCDFQIKISKLLSEFSALFQNTFLSNLFVKRYEISKNLQIFNENSKNSKYYLVKFDYKFGGKFTTFKIKI
ncbi:MAG: hypothetical protein K5978_07075 [Campylobacter sp.]|nr:hypothetical protein [Campylobacter sp.]